MNLWWSWQPRAIRLFQSIDPELWAQTDGNPRWMLHLLGAERIAELCQDRAFLAEVSSPEIVHSWEANPNNYERRKK